LISFDFPDGPDLDHQESAGLCPGSALTIFHWKIVRARLSPRDISEQKMA
jgi:hypothetical protein